MANMRHFLMFFFMVCIIELNCLDTELEKKTLQEMIDAGLRRSVAGTTQANDQKMLAFEEPPPLAPLTDEDLVVDETGHPIDIFSKGVLLYVGNDFFKISYVINSGLWDIHISKDESGYYKCRYCDKKPVENKNSIVRHLATQAKILQFECKLCNQSFAQLKNLQSHLDTKEHKGNLGTSGLDDQVVRASLKKLIDSKNKPEKV